MGLLDALFGQQGIPGATPPIVAGPGGLPQRRGFLGGLAGGLGNLGGLLGGGGNPSLMSPDEQAAVARRRQAMAIALLQASGPSTQRTGFGQALGNALQAGQMSDQGDLQNQLLQAQIGAIKAKPSQNNPSTVAEYEYAKAQGYKGTFEDWRNAQNATTLPSAQREYEYYSKLSPEEQKKFLAVKRTQNPYVFGDVAGGVAALNKGTGEYKQLTTAQQEAQGQGTVAGGKAAAVETGTKTAGAAFDLPRIKQNVDTAKADIQKLREHPGLGMITGLSSKLPIIPGTAQASADALAQQVQGQTFLQAFNQLRGGGSITETEGNKATQAIGRLGRAQSKADYQAALDDLTDVLDKGYARAQQQSGVAGGNPGKESAAERAKRLGIQ